jgi:hypothetical protein
MPLTAIPAPTATSFRVEFYLTHQQATGIPDLGTPLFSATLSFTQVHEQLEFTSLQVGCYSRVPAPSAFYSYSATLSTPFHAEPGVRYWINIMANTANLDPSWAWRVGRTDNGYSVFQLSSGTVTTYTTDLAFSLSQ